MWARFVCSPSLVPVLMCSLPNLCPSVSFNIAASANEVLPIPKDYAISTSHILFGVVRIMNGVRRGTWPEFFVVIHLGVS